MMWTFARPLTLMVGAMIALTACSTPDEPVSIYDPYEGTNRKIHKFNLGLDQVVVRPTSNAYGFLLPQPVRTGVSNFANYVDTPRFIANDLAQGNVSDAGHNFARFIMNTVFGLGVLDPASDAGLESRRTGFGETLHVWGAQEGAYIELPVFGPSNERDAVGTVVDFVSNPISGVLDGDADLIPPSSNVLDRLGARYEFRGSIDALLYESADSYAQARNLFLQNRRFELGTQNEADDDVFGDIYGE